MCRCDADLAVEEFGMNEASGGRIQSVRTCVKPAEPETEDTSSGSPREEEEEDELLCVLTADRTDLKRLISNNDSCWITNYEEVFFFFSRVSL